MRLFLGGKPDKTHRSRLPACNTDRVSRAFTRPTLVKKFAWSRMVKINAIDSIIGL